MFNLGSTYEFVFFQHFDFICVLHEPQLFGSCIMDARRRYNLARVESRRLELETYSRQWVFSPCRLPLEQDFFLRPTMLSRTLTFGTIREWARIQPALLRLGPRSFHSTPDLKYNRADIAWPLNL